MSDLIWLDVSREGDNPHYVRLDLIAEVSTSGNGSAITTTLNRTIGVRVPADELRDRMLAAVLKVDA